MKKQIWIPILIIAVIIVGLVIFVPRSKNLTDKEIIKIGVLADLSGDYSNLFKGAPRGVELAVENLRKETGENIVVIIEDQKSCDTKEVISAINKLINIDQVDFVVGGTCSNTTLAAAPIAESSKTIMISAMSSAPSITKAGDYIFRTYISDTARGTKLAKLIFEKLNKKKLALITDISNDGYVETQNTLKETFKDLGGEIVLDETTDRGGVDFKTILSKVKETNPDVISVGLGPTSGIALFKQKEEMGLETLVVSPFETLEDSNFLKIVGQIAEGSLIYVMPGNPPESPLYQELQNEYQTKYNEAIAQYVAESYDATMLGVKAVLKSNRTKEDIKDKLYSVSKDYRGVSGNTVFDVNGDVTKEVLFKTIKNGQFVRYEE